MCVSKLTAVAPAHRRSQQETRPQRPSVKKRSCSDCRQPWSWASASKAEHSIALDLYAFRPRQRRHTESPRGRLIPYCAVDHVPWQSIGKPSAALPTRKVVPVGTGPWCGEVWPQHSPTAQPGFSFSSSCPAAARGHKRAYKTQGWHPGVQCWLPVPSAAAFWRLGGARSLQRSSRQTSLHRSLLQQRLFGCRRWAAVFKGLFDKPAARPASPAATHQCKQSSKAASANLLARFRLWLCRAWCWLRGGSSCQQCAGSCRLQLDCSLCAVGSLQRPQANLHTARSDSQRLQHWWL